MGDEDTLQKNVEHMRMFLSSIITHISQIYLRQDQERILDYLIQLQQCFIAIFHILQSLFKNVVYSLWTFRSSNKKMNIPKKIDLYQINSCALRFILILQRWAALVHVLSGKRRPLVSLALWVDLHILPQYAQIFLEIALHLPYFLI